MTIKEKSEELEEIETTLPLLLLADEVAVADVVEDPQEEISPQPNRK